MGYEIIGLIYLLPFIVAMFLVLIAFIFFRIFRNRNKKIQKDYSNWLFITVIVLLCILGITIYWFNQKLK